jgi:hypothetical protein
VTCASLFRTLKSRRGIATGELNLGQVAGDRGRRAFDPQGNVTRERVVIKAARARDVAATRSRRAQIPQDERLQSTIAQASSGSKRFCEQEFTLLAALECGERAAGRLFCACRVELVESFAVL